MAPAKDKKTWFSHTAIEGLSRCPRCFWLQAKRGIRQPEGIVSRLANRFDVVVKRYFDLYRKSGELPPLVEGKVKGKLQDPFQEMYFYHHDNNYGYYGKLDECLVTDDGRYTPVDHKTSSSDPREKDTLPAYQNQLNAYAWLLEENSKRTSGIGHLIYFYPDHTRELHEGLKMVVHVATLKTDPGAAKEKFLNAIAVLERPIPQPSPDCPFCAWYDTVGKELEQK